MRRVRSAARQSAGPGCFGAGVAHSIDLYTRGYRQDDNQYGGHAVGAGKAVGLGVTPQTWCGVDHAAFDCVELPRVHASQRIDDDKRGQRHSKCGGKWKELVGELDMFRDEGGPWQSST
jgi:hypothetical protein